MLKLNFKMETYDSRKLKMTEKASLNEDYIQAIFRNFRLHHKFAVRFQPFTAITTTGEQYLAASNSLNRICFLSWSKSAEFKAVTSLQNLENHR